ncbi:transcriptional coactivator/pterin dehydratase [Biscogniauxia sp. FL1348]|nr:transcriptional coactivator/pterin dehydratase [Biscogniauxia sp. FL1348]
MRTLLRCFGGAITTATTTSTSCELAAAAILKVPRCTQLTTNSHHLRRSFVASAMASTTTSPTSPTTATFSPGVDETALSKALEPLLVTARQGGRWALIPSGEGLERSFKFKTFAKTWDFMTAVSLQCKLKNHHPEWSNKPLPTPRPLSFPLYLTPSPSLTTPRTSAQVYNTTYIRWTTHSPKGLSAKDVELAALCDALARDFGEVVPEKNGENDESTSCALKQVADRAVGAAGQECCVPQPAGKK